MAAPYNPPVKAEDFVLRIALTDYALTGGLRINPTIAAGDFKISKDGGALADLAVLPVVEPAGSMWVKVALSASEMTADTVALQAVDQTTIKEWSDWALCILTTV
jgi:hypothetical protein